MTHASGGIDHKVAEVVVHPDWNSLTKNNDIALLRIEGQLTLGTQDSDKIALAEKNELVPAGTTVTVTGWGRTSEGGDLPTTLLTLDVPVIDNGVCNQNYAAFLPITPQMFCAGVDGGGKDSCQV